MMIGKIKRKLAGNSAAVSLKAWLDRSFGFSAWILCRQNLDLENVDRRVVIKKMREHWRAQLGLSERTIHDWLCAAFNFPLFKEDVELIVSRFGPVAGKRVADIGCGWGSLLLLLAREEAMLDACDISGIHAEVAQMRVPNACVRQVDARNLVDFPDQHFDFVIEHDVFEHIGDYTGDTGPIGRTYFDKLRNLKEICRIMKNDGRGFLSTGNYDFPFNGEVNQWFVHWLPFEQQQRYLKSVGVDSDRYWLCTWEQIQSLFNEAGLVIEEVTTQLSDVVTFQKRIMGYMKKDPGMNETFAEILRELMTDNPRFMPTWKIFFRRKRDDE